MASVDLQERYSANVSLDLLVDGRKIPLAKVGPEKGVLQERHEIPAGQEAVLLMMVDGREHRWEIVLENGIAGFDEEFAFRVKRYPQQLNLFNSVTH